jgi:hypothetical protein
MEGGIRMQATGLRTRQPAFNRGFLGVVLATVVVATVGALLIVGTITRTPVGPAVASDISFDAATRAEIEFRALEPAAYTAMLKQGQPFRADERALTPAQAGADQREAVRKFHLKERAEKSSAATSQGAGAHGGIHGK